MSRKVWLAIDQMGVGGVGRSLTSWLPEMAALADVTVVAQMSDGGLYRDTITRHAAVFHPENDRQLLSRLRQDKPHTFCNDLVGGYVAITSEIRRHVPWLSCVLHTADGWSLSLVASDVAPLYDAVGVVAPSQGGAVQRACGVQPICVENLLNIPDSLQSQMQARAVLGLPLDGFLFGYAGRPCPDKGLGIVPQVLVDLLQQQVDAHFVFVGAQEDGLGSVGSQRDAYLRDLSNLFASRGLQTRLHILKAREDVQPVYRALDATVLLSQHEGSPLLLWESLACGTPFVSTDVGDVLDWFEPGLGCEVVSGASSTLVQDATAALLRIAYGKGDPTMCEARRSFCLQHKGIERWRRLYADNLATLLGCNR